MLGWILNALSVLPLAENRQVLLVQSFSGYISKKLTVTVTHGNLDWRNKRKKKKKEKTTQKGEEAKTKQTQNPA